MVDLNCQGWGRPPEKGEPGHPGSCRWGLGAQAYWGQPVLCPQVLGLTFAMTMYCQVVKADTYCA